MTTRKTAEQRQVLTGLVYTRERDKLIPSSVWRQLVSGLPGRREGDSNRALRDLARSLRVCKLGPRSHQTVRKPSEHMQ